MIAPLFRWVFCAAACSLIVGAGSHAQAQLEPIKGVLCRIGASDGIRRYRPGGWGLVEVYAVNRTGDQVETQAVMRFSDDPTLQYGRRVVVPPHSTLRSTCPILVPDFPTANSVDFVSEQVDPETGESVDRRSPHDSLLAPQSMILDYEQPVVTLIGDLHPQEFPESNLPFHTGRPYYPPAQDTPAYELVLAAKRTKLLSRRLSVLDPAEMPPDAAALDIVDLLVLCSDQLGDDLAALELLRNWVLGGGNLWIMLDEVNADTVTKMMGAAFQAAVVDRVGLTDIAIESVRTDVESAEPLEFHVDEPIEFVRLFAEGVHVTDRVDGWPAAFWQRFGSGRVFFTTLGAAAWMRRTRFDDPPPKTIDDLTNFFAREPMNQFAADCVVARQGPGVDERALQPFLSEQIGYRILSRNAVAAILAAFCLSLVASCAWLVWRRRAERILWAAPIAAALTSLVFYGIALATKRSVPPTVATVSRLELEPGNASGHAYGLAAMYNQNASADRLGAMRGGIFFPDMTALTGRRRRLTWTDEGEWHWEELELPAGVRIAPFEVGPAYSKAIDCQARFGPNGLSGTLSPLPFDRLQDALVVLAQQPAMATSIAEGGAFRVGSADILPPGTYFADSLLSDKQRRRSSIFAELFRQPTSTGDRFAPTLFAWADAADAGFDFPQSNQLGSTLVSIPIRIEKTRPGTKVAIPSPFVPYIAVANAAGRPPTAFGNLQREWIETKSPVTEWLRFQLPSAVLPLEVEEAQLTLNVRAPSRTLEVLVMSDGTPTAVNRLRHPLGVYSVTIGSTAGLRLDADGGFQIAIRVSEDEAADRLDPMTHGTWKIESLQMEVVGMVQRK